jgi:hypothetical protein
MDEIEVRRILQDEMRPVAKGIVEAFATLAAIVFSSSGIPKDRFVEIVRRAGEEANATGVPVAGQLLAAVAAHIAAIDLDRPQKRSRRH